MNYTVQITTDKTLKPAESVQLESQDDSKTVQIKGKKTLTLLKAKVTFKAIYKKGKPATEVEISGTTLEDKPATVVVS